MTKLSCILAAVACASCAGEVDGVLADPDPSRIDAPPGALGPYGVVVATRELASAEGTVVADVYRPFLVDANASDELIPAAPLALFIQGGLVPTERYRWFAVNAASRGSVAVVPHHVLDLAFFAQDAGEKAVLGARLAAAKAGDPLFARIAPGPGLVAGHSLGGVVAAKVWQKLGRAQLATLVLLASEPDPADSFGGRIGRVLSIVGSHDKKELPAKAIAGARKFDGATVAIIDGMNHYDLTDDPEPGELQSDGVSTISLADAHRDALTFVDAALDELRGDGFALADRAQWPEGAHAP